MDSYYHLSILYERLKNMNDLGGSDWSLKFNNDPKHQSKIDFDYLERKKSRLYRMASLSTRFISNWKRMVDDC